MMHTGVGIGTLKATLACMKKCQARACVGECHDQLEPEWVPVPAPVCSLRGIVYSKMPGKL